MGLRDRFATLMSDVAEVDKSLVVLVSDISHGILKPYAERFPNRYYNIGICEPAIVNLAAGLNHVGLTPVVHTIAPFLVERSFEQLKLDFGYQQKSVCLISVGSAFDYSQLGCSHHSYADVSLVSQIPGSHVFIPGSETELEALFWASYRLPGIKYFRLTENPHGLDVLLPKDPVGRGVKVMAGTDVTIMTSGAQLAHAKIAADELATRGLSAEVLYFPTFKPFDSRLVQECVARTGRLLSVEEVSARDGLYAQACQALINAGPIKTHQLAIRHFIHEYGTYEQLCTFAGLDVDAIVNGCVELCADD